MNQRTKPQRHGLSFFDDHTAWLSLCECLPPERVRYQESAFSRMKPGAAEVLRIGHQPAPATGPRVVGPVGLPTPDLFLVLAPLAAGNDAAFGHGHVARHPDAESHLFLIAK